MTERFAVDLERTIPGPRAEVYAAFLDPEVVQQWMSPAQSVVTAATVDPRPGGKHVVEMLSNDGSRHAFESVIRELVPDERIVLDFTFVGAADGRRIDTIFTVTFRDAEDGGTQVRLEQERVERIGSVNEQSVNTGWNGVLDKLEALYRRS